ncbi:hypothetical protein Tco_0832235 [Tanacetum coccineum]
MDQTILKSHVEKPEKFKGFDFRCWQQKMLFYLTSLHVSYVLINSEPTYMYLMDGENVPTEAQVTDSSKSKSNNKNKGKTGGGFGHKHSKAGWKPGHEAKDCRHKKEHGGGSSRGNSNQANHVESSKEFVGVI